MLLRYSTWRIGMALEMFVWIIVIMKKPHRLFQARDDLPSIYIIKQFHRWRWHICLGCIIDMDWVDERRSDDTIYIIVRNRRLNGIFGASIKFIQLPEVTSVLNDVLPKVAFTSWSTRFWILYRGDLQSIDFVWQPCHAYQGWSRSRSWK